MFNCQQFSQGPRRYTADSTLGRFVRSPAASARPSTLLEADAPHSHLPLARRKRPRYTTSQGKQSPPSAFNFMSPCCCAGQTLTTVEFVSFPSRTSPANLSRGDRYLTLQSYLPLSLLNHAPFFCLRNYGAISNYSARCPAGFVIPYDLMDRQPAQWIWSDDPLPIGSSGDPGPTSDLAHTDYWLTDRKSS
ncbi:hypothetical protein BaRGS_00006739 [Batillaria attramentaria]|uniref:Uncharacterized protein n=1 Tax=Batillaria attramentaria TaxID=370345 RepID=A0ABD0LSG7_9CAEN